MKKVKFVMAMLMAGCLLVCLYGLSAAAEKPETLKEKQEAKAKSIDVNAEADTNHPEVEEGLTCNDCHEIKLDAKTTATQVWLTGESPGRNAGEGLFPKDRLWQKVVATIGGIKKDSKTFVLGTCLNNVPLTTTAEFTLDAEKKMLYGFHEAGTEKLIHIKNNPKVSLNWHKEFETFADFCCVQVRGTAELIDSGNPDYERILKDFLPYEDGARVPKDATPRQREERLKNFRKSLSKGFVISRIKIERITMASMDFTKEGFRRYQRLEFK